VETWLSILCCAALRAGANAVPVDIFHSRMTPEAVRELVASAADANMNMIRVWGGGLYYRDEFYDACDAAGLMVWQEAMFACSLYPANQAFLEDVCYPPLLSPPVSSGSPVRALLPYAFSPCASR
jgi:beta-galactosidase/beta-glucuronidase